VSGQPYANGCDVVTYGVVETQGLSHIECLFWGHCGGTGILSVHCGDESTGSGSKALSAESLSWLGAVDLI